jgi:hypothetical protein
MSSDLQRTFGTAGSNMLLKVLFGNFLLLRHLNTAAVKVCSFSTRQILMWQEVDTTVSPVGSRPHLRSMVNLKFK